MNAPQSPDNGPNIGLYGPAELAKEARWAEERERHWRRFQAEAALILAAPTRQERAYRLDLYRQQFGELSARTMQGWIARIFERRKQAAEAARQRAERAKRAG